MEKMVSLYDYLGRAAGKKLGEEVAIAARTMQIPMEKRYVQNKKYKGFVLLYPENWLIGYFSTGQSNYNKQETLTL